MILPEPRRKADGPAADIQAADFFARDVHCLLGLPFDAVDLAAAVRSVRRAAGRRQRFVLATPNLNFLIACRTDPAFRDSVLASDLSIADGMPIVWLARLFGVPLPGRVAGSDLFEALARGEGRRQTDERLGVYFFGGPDGAAPAAASRLQAAGPGLACAGWDSPGFGGVEEISGGERLARINRSGADFLVLALGARKGQAWIARNRQKLTVPVMSHLGAVLNHVAGSIRRAPPWMQRNGLEWLWRIREEPALWRRYAGDAVACARLLASSVLPLLWQRWRRRAGRAAAIAVHTGGEQVELRLQGAWTRASLAPLRGRLAQGLLAGRDLHLDLGEVDSVDSAFLGLLMLIRAYQKRQGRRLVIAPPPARLRRLFACHGAAFLLAGEGGV